MINRSVACSPFNNGHCYGSNSTIPKSVNYHFTRQCNYKCGFCFHTAKTSFVLPLDEAKRGLKILKEAGRNNNYYKTKLQFEAKYFFNIYNFRNFLPRNMIRTIPLLRKMTVVRLQILSNFFQQQMFVQNRKAIRKIMLIFQLKKYPKTNTATLRKFWLRHTSCHKYSPKDFLQKPSSNLLRVFDVVCQAILKIILVSKWQFRAKYFKISP